jgi:hypothetical protein
MIKGVPISSQWKKDGHIYPIQVGQFGLSHFSKWIQTKDSWSDRGYRHKLTVVQGNSKFIHHENKDAFVRPLYAGSLEEGFEFKFDKAKAIYKTNYSFDIRYVQAQLSTSSFLELKFDLMLRDPALAPGNFIVRLVYVLSYDS